MYSCLAAVWSPKYRGDTLYAGLSTGDLADCSIFLSPYTREIHMDPQDLDAVVSKKVLELTLG